MGRFVADTAGRKVVVVLGAGAWVAVFAWSLIELLDRLSEPDVTVDTGDLVALLASAMCALPVGAMVGVLGAWLPEPSPRVWTVREQVNLLIMGLSISAMAAIPALTTTLTSPGEGTGGWGPGVGGALPAFLLGAILAYLTTMTWRRLETLGPGEPAVASVGADHLDDPARVGAS